MRQQVSQVPKRRKRYLLPVHTRDATLAPLLRCHVIRASHHRIIRESSCVIMRLKIIVIIIMSYNIAAKAMILAHDANMKVDQN